MEGKYGRDCRKGQTRKKPVAPETEAGNRGLGEDASSTGWHGVHLKVTCYVNKEKLRGASSNGREIGLDFGIHTNITTSEGEKLDVSVEESERLKRLQRKLSRQEKGSNGRYRTVRSIQRQYLKLTNTKKDKANKIVHKLRQYSTIVMQDEQIANWHKTGELSRKVQHSCMGMIKARLMLLPQTIVLDKYIPTTKWCPHCHRLNALSLGDRTYRCECGYVQDRDVHAAQNMLDIKNLVFRKASVPMERREVKRVDFDAACAEG